ncbi:hypothetical protein [Candidatus Stoquefichus massiliensis]|uniref:hypothetical protein n=1 Tax=Candidatus Stoquefichus massiliensis TaxID=1470350 RepID=UPI0004879470|nr:hypothetical protein [Candidatus Stoquefichus massiliensis]
MFNHVSYKIKISAYVFFGLSVIRTCFRDIQLFMQLGSPNDLLIDIILGMVNKIVMYFIVSLFIYVIGRVVERFENFNNQDIISR